jgi:hypothetical protein
MAAEAMAAVADSAEVIRAASPDIRHSVAAAVTPVSARLAVPLLRDPVLDSAFIPTVARAARRFHAAL